MSVSGFTPPTAETPSTSSGSTHPAVPALKAPRLAGGSCASEKLEHTSTAELVRALAAASPATPHSEGGGEATYEVHDLVTPRSSPAATEGSSRGSQVTSSGGGDLGRPRLHRRADAFPTTKTELHTGTATESGFSVTAGMSSTPEDLTVPGSSQGSVQGERLATTAEMGATAQRAGGGMGCGDSGAGGSDANVGGSRAACVGLATDSPPSAVPPTLGPKEETKVQDKDAGFANFHDYNDDLDPEAEADYAAWTPLPRAATLQPQVDEIPDVKEEDTTEADLFTGPSVLGSKPEAATSGTTFTTESVAPPVATTAELPHDSESSDAHLSSSFDVLGFRRVFKPTHSRPITRSILELSREFSFKSEPEREEEQQQQQEQ